MTPRHVLNKTGVVNSDNIFNRAFGSVYDLLQAGVQQQLLMADSTSQFIAEETNKTLNNPGTYVYWVAHSQGGADIAAAWNYIDDDKKDRIRVITAAGANFYGFPGAGSYDAVFKSGDIVPKIMGSWTPFLISEVNRYYVNGFKNPLKAHDFESYVNCVAERISAHIRDDSK